LIHFYKRNCKVGGERLVVRMKEIFFQQTKGEGEMVVDSRMKLKDVVDTSDTDREEKSEEELEESETDLAALKMRSLVSMERSLLCQPPDSSPIQPSALRQAETSASCVSMEKLLMERLLLRKELRLRSMQERLVEQAQRLEEVESQLKNLENLTGFRLWLRASRGWEGLVQNCGKGARGVSEGGRWLLGSLYKLVVLVMFQAPLVLLDRVPTRLSLFCAAIVFHLGSLAAQRAENFSNECQENLDRREDRMKGGNKRSRRRKSR